MKKNENKIILSLLLMCLIFITIMITLLFKIKENSELICNYNSYDVNKDGVVDAVDYVKIYKYIMEEK